MDGIDPSVAKSIRTAQQKVNETPRSAEAWGHLGMLLHAHVFAEEARVCYVEAERRDNKDPRWPYLQANLQLSRIPDEAVPAMRRGGGNAGEVTRGARWGVRGGGAPNHRPARGGAPSSEDSSRQPPTY